ncbi:hypothetical protein CYY_009689, partial [Polysphondylium violaceum]
LQGYISREEYKDIVAVLNKSQSKTILYILFLIVIVLAVPALVVTYIVTDHNMQTTTIVGIIAIFICGFVALIYFLSAQSKLTEKANLLTQQYRNRGIKFIAGTKRYYRSYVATCEIEINPLLFRLTTPASSPSNTQYQVNSFSPTQPLLSSTTPSPYSPSTFSIPIDSVYSLPPPTQPNTHHYSTPNPIKETKQ